MWIQVRGSARHGLVKSIQETKPSPDSFFEGTATSRRCAASVVALGKNGEIMPNNNLDDALTYLRANEGLHALWDALIQKYRGLGRFGGKILLVKLNEQQATALSRFLPRGYQEGEDARIDVAEILRQYKMSRFGAVDLRELLGAYQGNPLVTKKAASGKKRESFHGQIDSLRATYSQDVCQHWLGRMTEHAAQLRSVAEQADFFAELNIVLRALAQLPSAYCRLPVFASQVCGDPHGFDSGQALGRHLRLALKSWAAFKGSLDLEIEGLSHTERDNRLLNHFKLIRDDITNFFSAYGLLAFREGKCLPQWRAAFEDGAVLNVPLRELLRVDRLHPVKGTRLFVVENSGVFSALVGQGQSSTAFLCLHGQLKLSGWLALERMVADRVTFSYSGDFDPEGLLIAQHLLRRFPEHARLWRMSVADYHEARPEKKLSPTRLAKLDSIVHPALAALADAIRAVGAAAYQEALLSRMHADCRDDAGLARVYPPTT